MRTTRLLRLAAVWLGLGVAVSTAPAWAQHGDSQPPPKPPLVQPGDPKALAQSDAQQLAETIDRVEAEYFGHGHKYASFEKLQELHLFKGKAALPVQVGPSGELKDHILRLLVSADGSHYMLSVVPVQGGCGFAFFSDETGAVYPSDGLDCTE